MGSVIYDILGETPLLVEEHHGDAFRDFSDAELERIIAQYREQVLSKLPDLDAEIAAHQGRMRVLSGLSRYDSTLLSQCAWYVEQFIVNDPIFVLSRPLSIAQRPLEKLHGLNPSRSLDRPALVSAAKAMARAKSMVAANYVKFYPLSARFEPPAALPVRISETAFSDEIPPGVLAHLRSRAGVHRVEVRDGSMIVRLESATWPDPCRAIAVQLGAPPWPDTMIYHLFEQRITGFDEASRIAQFAMTLPAVPPDKASYEAWVNQSINQTANGVYHKLHSNIALAARHSAHYLTRSELEAEVLGLGDNSSQSVESATAAATFLLDVPFVENISTDDLMRVRVDDGEAFAAFRLALEAHCRAIRMASSSDEARALALDARHELAEVQLGAVERKLSGLRTKLLANAAIALAGLSSSVVSGGWSLAAAAVAAANGFHSFADYQAQARENPAYFLWRAGARTRQS